MKTGFFTKNSLLVLVFSSVAVGGAHADVPALTVSSNQILSGGEAKSFAGNSFFSCNTGLGQEKMYNASVVKWLKDDWKSTIIRVVLSVDEDGSYLDDPEGNTERIETVVEAAIANDMYVIIDVNYDHTENNKSEAIAFFEQMALKYGAHNNVIYEIYSEPLQLSWKGSIKPYAEDVISAIRSIDPDNLIIVGTSKGSQDVDVASQDPIMGDNIAYALHFYAGTHGQSLRDKATMAMNNGIPLVVTQWGTANADGGGKVDEISSNEWMTFLRKHNLTHLNWGVSDKDASVSIIKPSSNPEGNWVASDLTTSGAYVREAISNWNSPSNSSGGSFFSEETDNLGIDLINFDELIEEVTDVNVNEDSLTDAMNDFTEALAGVAVDVDVDVNTPTDVNVDVNMDSPTDADDDVDVDSPTVVDVDIDSGSNDIFDDLTEQIVYVGVEVGDMPNMDTDTGGGSPIDTLGALSEVIVNVNVNVNTPTNVDVSVDLGDLGDLGDPGDPGDLGDLGELFDTEDLEGLLEQITSNELVDAVDLILNSDLDNIADLILSSDPTSVADQIFESDLFDAIDQIDLNSSINRICNNSSLCLIDEAAINELIEQIQLENQVDLLFNAIDLIKILDQLQSDNQADLSSDGLSDLISMIDQGESEIPLDILNDVIDLITMSSEIESVRQLETDDLMALVSSIALLLQNNTTEPEILDVTFFPDSFSDLFDQAITDVPLVPDFPFMSK
jgi:aryl-phospho-beta-D-glucosidase BglC (GH1 family)